MSLLDKPKIASMANTLNRRAEYFDFPDNRKPEDPFQPEQDARCCLPCGLVMLTGVLLAGGLTFNLLGYAGAEGIPPNYTLAGGMKSIHDIYMYLSAVARSGDTNTNN